jgi:hypothetical protein
MGILERITVIIPATMSFISAGPGSISPEPFTNTLILRSRLTLAKGIAS